jgi:hypothetical protein
VWTWFTICSHTEVRHSTWLVLQFLESLKDVESDWIGNQSSFTTSSFWFDFASLLISALVALTAQLEAPEKALSEEKVVPLATDQSLAEEKTAQQVANQSLQASKEAKDALAQDL